MDEFVNHRMPKCLLLFWLLLFLLAGALSWWGSGVLTGYILTETLSLQQPDMPPVLLPGYDALQELLFAVLLCLSGSFCLLGAAASLLPLWRFYRQLADIRQDCYAVAEQLQSTVALQGEDFSSIRRVCDGINLIANRMHGSLSHLAKERAELKDFLTDFSHQLKTSLAVIRLHVDMLTELPQLTDVQKDRLSAEISLHLDNMQELVVSALKLARLGADAVIFQFEDALLSDTCTRTVQHLQPLLKQAGITVDCHFAAADLLPHDPIWLKEAIGNLLKNAIDHADCRRIRLETQVLPACVKLCLEDDGKGLDQQEIPHLFDRFGKRSRQSGMQNAGVGLAIAKEIIAAHHGEITVYAAPGEGTRFEVLFLV